MLYAVYRFIKNHLKEYLTILTKSDLLSYDGQTHTCSRPLKKVWVPQSLRSNKPANERTRNLGAERTSLTEGIITRILPTLLYYLGEVILLVLQLFENLLVQLYSPLTFF
jgi:hypothetical protein